MKMMVFPFDFTVINKVHWQSTQSGTFKVIFISLYFQFYLCIEAVMVVLLQRHHRNQRIIGMDLEKP